MSERSVRNYCLQGRIVGALLEGKTWIIPSDAEKPRRKIRHTAKQDTLLSFLKREKETGLKGGIYHKIQIDLTYNSNHIEGSKLTHDQTRFIFETKTLGVTNEVPFQDGNGRIGRLILFKECLKHNIVPFIITEELKLYYYRGIKNWKNERGFLRDTCLTAQDIMKQCLDYFGIVY